jgi:hypothetical protein
MSRMGAGTLLFFSLLAVYLITASGRIDSGDGLAVFAVSQSLLEGRGATVSPPDLDEIVLDAQGRPMGRRGDLEIEDGYSIRGRQGNYYSPTGLGQSLWILPLMVLGQIAAAAIHWTNAQWAMQFAASMLFGPVVSASSGLLVYLTGRRLSFAPRTSMALAVVYAFGTMAWVYAKSFFGDSLIALLLLLAFYALVSYRQDRRSIWLWIGGASLGYAILTKPAGLINAPILLVYLLFIARTEPRHALWSHLLAFAIPVAIGVGGLMSYNWWRFGSLLDNGYRNSNWTFPFLLGLYGLVASPGKGYLLYNPISLGAIAAAPIFWRRYKPEAWVIIGVIVVNLLFLATYDHWHGGGCWGPRYLLPITPFAILPLGSLLEPVSSKRLLNLLLATLIAGSIVIQIPAVFVNFGRYLQNVYDLSAEQYFQRITFQAAYSPLIGQWGEMRAVVGNLKDPARRTEISQSAFQGGADMTEAIKVLSMNLPDFWFVYLGFIPGSPQ